MPHQPGGRAMRMFVCQGVDIDQEPGVVFDFVSNPSNLPKWAHAFSKADGQSARLETAAGAVEIRLQTTADRTTGIVDWRMEFPDGSIALAQSRVTQTT